MAVHFRRGLKILTKAIHHSFIHSYTCTYHLGVVVRYFSAAVVKDMYGQSEDRTCLGMLQGCVEHEVCREDMMEESTCFFWKVHDANSAGALRWAERDGCIGDTAGEQVQ